MGKPPFTAPFHAPGFSATQTSKSSMMNGRNSSALSRRNMMPMAIRNSPATRAPLTPPEEEPGSVRQSPINTNAPAVIV